jgi:hypothetical protein
MNTHLCVHENLNILNITDIWQIGCYEKVHSAIETKYALIGGIGFACSLFIFLGSLLSCCLARNIRKNRYEPME